MDEHWWRNLWRSFSGRAQQPPPASVLTMDPQPQMDAESLRGLVDVVFSTRPDELDCDECFELVDQFAELFLAGKPAAEMMPLVQDHLDRCPPCREEFEALLDALKALA